MSFISTGALPPADAIVRALDTVHDEVRPVTDGVNSPVYPMLASASSAWTEASTSAGTPASRSR